MNQNEDYDTDNDSFATAGSFSQDQVFFLTRKVAINEEIEKRKSENSQLKQTIAERFAARDTRNDALEQRENLNEEIQTQVAALQARIKEIDASLQTMNSIAERSLQNKNKVSQLEVQTENKFNTLKSQNEALQKELHKSKEELSQVKTQFEKQVSQIEEKFMDTVTQLKTNFSNRLNAQQSSINYLYEHKRDTNKVDINTDKIDQAVKTNDFSSLQASANETTNQLKSGDLTSSEKAQAIGSWNNAYQHSRRNGSRI